MVALLLLAIVWLAAPTHAAFHISCPATPPTGCGITEAAALAMRVTLLPPSPDRSWVFQPKTRFRWDGSGAGFGDPTTGETAFSACLYDDAGLAWQGVTFARVSLWDFPVTDDARPTPNLIGVLLRETVAWRARTTPTFERHEYFHRGGPWGVGPLVFEQRTGRQRIRAGGPDTSYAALPPNPTGGVTQFEQQPGGGAIGTQLRPPPYSGAVTYAIIAGEPGIPGARCWGETFVSAIQNDARGYRAKR